MSTKTQQRRYLNRPGQSIRLQERAGALPTISGYAAVFYREGDAGTAFRMWDDWEERIIPGAFDRALKEDDVRALFNHDAANILGRTASGTLRLTVDERGLRYEIDPPDTQLARDVIESIRRGDVSGSSFAFIPRGQTSKRENGVYICEVRDVQLFDVGPVTYPAYSGTEANARSATGAEAMRAAIEGRAHLDIVELSLAVMRAESDA